MILRCFTLPGYLSGCNLIYLSALSSANFCSRSARNLKNQETQALRNLYSVSDHPYTSADPTVTQSAPATGNTIPLEGSIPSELSPATRESWARHRRDAFRQNVLESVGLYPTSKTNPTRPDEWASGSRMPGRVMGVASGSMWGQSRVIFLSLSLYFPHLTNLIYQRLDMCRYAILSTACQVRKAIGISLSHLSCFVYSSS